MYIVVKFLTAPIRASWEIFSPLLKKMNAQQQNIISLKIC